MGHTRPLQLAGAVGEFADRLLARHPNWASYLAPYKPVSAGDATAEGSLWIEIPSPHDPTASLWAIVQPGEVLVGLGHRAAEALFVWQPAEADEIMNRALAFIDDIIAAEVVGAWERHRFLWRTWETCQFRRAADVADDSRIVRVSAWPAPANTRRDAATS